MTANIIPLPSARRQELLNALGNRPTPPVFLDTLNTFAREDWGLAELEKLAPSVPWHVEPKSLDLFAKLLGQYYIEFDEPANRLASDSASAEAEPKFTEAEKEGAAELLKSGRALAARQMSFIFTRAYPIASLLDDALKGKSPLKIIEKHMQQVFRPNPPIKLKEPIELRKSEPLVGMFRTIAAELEKNFPSDARSQAIAYFLSNPHENNGKDVTIAELRKLLQLGFPYTRLLFVRFTVWLCERLDPTPERWDDLKWLFEFAKTPWEMIRVISACFELIDHAWDLFRDAEGTVEPTLRAFFEKVRKEQSNLDGRSFWDESTATSMVYQYFRWHAYLDNVQTDFHSHLCWMAQEGHEPGEPGFPEWNVLVREALDEGYVALAQALTAYKVIEEVLLLDRITDWPAFTALNRMLRAESHYEILANAIQISAAIWKARGRNLLSERLTEQAPKSQTPDERVLHLIEGATRPTSKEVELRLVEHIGKHNWEKLTGESRNWLIEADMNWSDFNFRDKEDRIRTDWSAPAAQYFKTIEHELVIRYGTLCREAGDCSKGPRKEVSFGQVVTFLRKASTGDIARSAILKHSKLEPVPTVLLKRLDRL